jgi:anti-anti-sigma factor
VGTADEYDVTFESELADGVLAIRVGGELDMLTAPEMDEYVRAKVADTRPAHVIVDLAAVVFMGSSGLSVLFALASEISDAHLHLTGAASHHVVERAINLVGLDKVIDIRPDLDALRTELGG